MFYSPATNKSFRSTLARTFATLAASICIIALPHPTTAAPQTILTKLTGHIPAAVAASKLIGRLNPSTIVPLAFSLPLRDPQGLQDLLPHLYDPTDPAYEQFLTTDEITDQFGPTQADYDAVIAYATAAGFTVTKTYTHRLVLDVSAPANVVETAFGLHLLQYQDASGNNFYAPDVDPSLPAGIAARLDDVVGLHNEPAGHTASAHAKLSSPTWLLQAATYPFAADGIGTISGIGTGADGGLSPSDIKNAYGLSGVNLTGAGQILILFECDGYIANDITTYENYYGLPHVPLQNVYIDGVDGVPGSSSFQDQSNEFGPFEATFDIELSAAIAPSASKILVYECPLTDLGFGDAFAQMVNDYSVNGYLGRQISVSWGGAEQEIDYHRIYKENTYFGELAAQGRCVYVASGDRGVANDPATQTSAVGVGGTALTTQGAGGGWQSEVTWDEGSQLASGGGVSTYWNIPSYQQGSVPASSGGSQTMRNVPDVALDAANSSAYSGYFSDPTNKTGGAGYYTGIGTSFASPIWAAFTALVNQQRLASNKPSIGFTNPALYQIARSSRYAADFHDITTGSSLSYSAGTGYDLTTGLGSFIGANLLNDLAPSRYDFDGNGHADLLWQNVGAASGIPLGEIDVWTMGGSSGTSVITGSRLILPGNPANPTFPDPGSWHVVGSADFNGDGHPDVLFQNVAPVSGVPLGAIDVWTVSGTQVLNGYQVVLPNNPANPVFPDPAVWTLSAAGDFNGDGHPDLLFQNRSTGELDVWYMNGVSETSAVQISVPGGYPSPAAWRVAGVTSINGDGKANILWQNLQSVSGIPYGAALIWYMNGVTYSSSNYVQGVSAFPDPTQWTIVGTADFNEDGATDLLWQKQGGGVNGISCWFLNGINYTGSSYINGGGTSPSTTQWQIREH